jgi:pilus assembly protein CpaC
VELASGQSFAIAGLFQNNVQNQVQQMPWLGDLPVLGALFRSASFQRNESELVIIVTPYVVAPAPGPGDLHLPTEGIVFASDLEQMLLGRLTTTEGKAATPEPASADRPHLSGAAGLILE